jgi:acyl-coenzyme A synthetase/AMP-(fatty) acid ligase
LNLNYPELIYRTGDLVKLKIDGDIIFIGRADQQIKRYGYRIDLQEIDHILISSIGCFTNACALYNSENSKITIFYEADEAVDHIAIKNKLALLLPKYMMPDFFVFMQELPRNTNGKIDRQLLKILTHSD